MMKKTCGSIYSALTISVIMQSEGVLVNMRIKHRFAFGTRKINVVQSLEQQGVELDISYGIAVFEIFEDNDKFNAISDLMSSNNITSIPTAIYTKEEIEAAQWLTVRSSWRSLYPQPIDDFGFLRTTYDATDYCEKAKGSDGLLYWCGNGLVQKENFILAKEPNWGPRNFLMVNCVEDELFISPKTEETLRTSDLSGFEIYDVLNKKRNVMSGVKQLFVKNYLGEGLCDSAILKKMTCPKCGYTKYILKAGANCFSKEAFEGVREDIIKSKEKIGGMACFNLIIVTHKFYDVITKAKLDRGLVFEPVELI